jgi:2-polyprenyl-3-methyl-5-hydroxy-6-metoxy-1,4-benzoquinol methylase
MAYQDTWIRGRVAATGDRPCAWRYEVVRQVVASYTRQVTVWDIGANLGYFGNRLAHDYEAISVMVDSRPALIDVCRENDDPRTVALLHRMTAQDLAELAASDHADVVLALNVLHHMPDWRQALDAVLALGEQVIVETPGRGDTGSVNYEASQLLLDVFQRAVMTEPRQQVA